MRTMIIGSGGMVLTAAAVLMLEGSAYAQRSDDGVRLITQRAVDRGNVTADDTPGFPATISESGSYRLGSNLILPDGNTTGIEITASNVVLDLNGFSILGPGVPGTGVGILGPSGAAGERNITILNGAVDGVGGIGVHMPAVICRVERVHILNSGEGIRTHRGCTLVNNIIIRNRSTGISAGGGNTVIGNTVRANFGLGMTLPQDAGYVQNVVTENNGGNANVQVLGGIQMGMNVCGITLCP